MSGAALRDTGISDRLHFPSLEPVRTGMPELCRVGLSENWLLKACGHRHWLALAEAHGQGRPLFHDRNGARLYPAFIRTALSDALLETVQEDCFLDFSVTLSRLSRTRFRSEIGVTCDDRPIAKLAMESIFIRRSVEGSNHATCRAVVAGPCRLLPPLRKTAVTPLPHEGGAKSTTLFLDPSPHEHFNGVGFLYFSAFQAMLDRAEWSIVRQTAPLLVTRRRDICYLGNIELGDRLQASVHSDDQDAMPCRHFTTLMRMSDKAIIARAWTVRERLT